MAKLSGQCPEIIKLLDAFGLKNVRSFKLKVAYNSIATITAEFFPEYEGIKKIIPIIKKYKLVEIEPEKDAES